MAGQVPVNSQEKRCLYILLLLITLQTPYNERFCSRAEHSLTDWMTG